MSTARPAAVPVPRRACLAVPGHNAKMHVKALARGADEVVLDLEDAVADDAKEEAREVIATTLADPAWAGVTVAVRVNARDTRWHDDDVAWLGALRTDARLSVVVPKVESATDVLAVSAALDAAGAPAALELQALLETPTAVAAARDVAAAGGRLASLIIGFADLAAELRRRGAQDDTATWLPVREAVLLAAREHGLQAIDGPHFKLGDPSSLAEATLQARDLGFDGKWAIHPEQVPVLLRVFSPSPAEREHAAATIAALDAAAGAGDAAVRVGGKMVDEAHRPDALRILAVGSGPDDRDAQATQDVVPVALPFYEDLAVGDVFTAPGVTLDAGLATLHRSIIGDRLALALDAPLARDVTGGPDALAHPMLVCDVAIGQSTAPSARVLGNLFYRGLAARPVPLGTTLRTRTEIVAKRRAKTAKGGAPRGLVVLRVTTTDEHGDAVVDFHRCPLLPAREDRPDEAGDSFDGIGSALDDAQLRELTPRWSLAPLRALGGPSATEVVAGTTYAIEARETVTSAPELARVTLNQALTHTDAGGSHHGRRLVYGGHVIGIAAAHVTRVFPSLATILAWRSCDHLGPTFEGDRLATTVEVERVTALDDGALLDLRVRVAVDRGDAGSTPVLDWRLVALLP